MRSCYSPRDKPLFVLIEPGSLLRQIQARGAGCVCVCMRGGAERKEQRGAGRLALLDW